MGVETRSFSSEEVFGDDGHYGPQPQRLLPRESGTIKSSPKLGKRKTT